MSPSTPTSAKAIAAAANGLSFALELEALGLGSAATTAGNFFLDLTSSELYKNTTVIYLLPLQYQTKIISFKCFLF